MDKNIDCIWYKDLITSLNLLTAMIDSSFNQPSKKGWLVVAAIIVGISLLTYQYIATHRQQPPAPTANLQPVSTPSASQNILIVHTNKPQANAAAIKTLVQRQNANPQVKKSKVPLVVRERITTQTLPATVADNKDTLNDAGSEFSEKVSLLDSFYRSIAKQPVVHQINPQNDTTLNLPEGTVIAIPAYTLVYPNGKLVSGTVTFSVTEFYDKASMICNRLSTLSNGYPLVTGGMLSLTAKDATGMELTIKTGGSIDVQIPYKTRDENMELFMPVSKPATVKAKAGNSAIQMLNSLDWMASGQMQTRMPEPTAYVINWTSQPEIIYGNKMKAIYLIDQDCELTNEQVKEEIKKRFPEYDKVKVKRAWKHPIRFLGIGITSALATFGERESMPLAKAKKLKLVTPKEEVAILKAFQQELKQYRDDSIRLAAMAQLQSKYGFKVSSMGLINYDRFYNDSRPKVWYTINKTDAADGKFVHRLFFHSLNAIMPAYWETDKAFANIPVGEEVTLVSVGEKNGQTLASFKTFTTDQSNSVLTLNYQPTEPAAFKKELQQRIDAIQH